MSNTVWRNWSRTYEVTPVRLASPTSLQDLVSAVQAAITEGLHVKAVGAGHSFSPIAEAAGLQVNLDRMSGLLSIDKARRQVTLGAGTRLHQIPALLAPHGLAMENLGDIDTQSIAGAISTGTHGTGAGFRGIAAQVVGAVLVTGTGDVLRVNAEHNAHLLPAVALGLGALGILAEVTIACVDAFDLTAVERPEPIEAVLENLPERAAEADHFEFFWFPHTETALTKVNTRRPSGEERSPLSRARRWFDDDLLSNDVFRATCAVGRAVPAVVPLINRAVGHLTGHRSFSDASTNVFTTHRNVRFTEMEYAIPAEQAADAFREVRRAIERNGWRISFPVEVRFAAADDLWLSTAHGRATAYVAVHRVVGEDAGDYFRTVESIMRARGGRPHWGKMHWRSAADLAPSYPRFEDFRALRAGLDPQGIFSNNYLTRVLG
ncbi:FAD-linked oxidoreductase [Tessaracoccus aquimaris]|uniref:FAD-linked oxidoreductase n=1 Tax=Tessaracoccus aquimaris TaxID=1332264 RepID=A0A1Q2CN36_9ACTN|nr:D-arabinono-1,4-lactone oxidase [Tessaracoccus aquimaris]AQP47516.1 FAD-linked oxidoreductase [Tessaracoccus aquimaris]